MKKDKKLYCQNCVNKRKSEFALKISGLKIELCKVCWIGFAYAIRQDFEMFNRSESEFRQAVLETKKYEES